MKPIIPIAFILLLLCSMAASAVEYLVLPVIEVYDGDTIKTVLAERRLPAPLNKVSIRIRGIDTPEMPAKSYATTGKLGRAKCVQEAELAIAAKMEVQRFQDGDTTKMRVYNFEWGKFGGRIVGDVRIGGTDIAQHLIARGMAVAYDGGKKTKDWCE